MSYYVKSKSKTGRKPRTGNRYMGGYAQVADLKNEPMGERVFVLIGYKIKKGSRVKDIVAFNSQAAAVRAGWVKI